MTFFSPKSNEYAVAALTSWHSTNCQSRSQDSWLVRAPGLWSKGCEFESWQKCIENFLLQSQLCVLTLIQCPFHPCVTAVAHKRPWSFCQKCRWQVTPKHEYTFDPMESEWADCATFQAKYGTCQEMSSHAICQGILGHSCLSMLSHCGLILAKRMELVCSS